MRAALEVRVVEVQSGFAKPVSQLIVGDEGSPRVVTVGRVNDLGVALGGNRFERCAITGA